MIRLSFLCVLLLALSCNTPKNADIPVEGTEWTLVAYRTLQTSGDVQQAIEGKGASLMMENGKLTGSTGCNRYNGSYTMSDKQLQTAQIVMTKKFCQDVAEQEKAFTTVLNADPLVSMEDGQLVLATTKGEKLFFRQMAADQATSAVTLTEGDIKKK